MSKAPKCDHVIKMSSISQIVTASLFYI